MLIIRLQDSMDDEKLFTYPPDIARFSWSTVRELYTSLNAVNVKW